MGPESFSSDNILETISIWTMGPESFSSDNILETIPIHISHINGMQL